MYNPAHPGEIVREAIDAEGWTVSDAATRLGVTRNTLSRVLNRRAGVSPRLASALEGLGWSDAGHWVRMQGAFDLARSQSLETTVAQASRKPSIALREEPHQVLSLSPLNWETSVEPELLLAAIRTMATVASAFARWVRGSAANGPPTPDSRSDAHLSPLRQQEAEHFRGLLASLGRTIALTTADWNRERNRELDAAIKEMKTHASRLEALGTPLSSDLSNWTTEKDLEGRSIPRNVYYELGHLHAIADRQRERYLATKMSGLRELDEKLR